MPDPKSAAIPPKPGAETGDDEAAALQAAVHAIRQRVDAMGKRDDDRRKKDDDDRRDAPVDMSEIASMLRVILRHLGEDGDAPAADDDDRKDFLDLHLFGKGGSYEGDDAKRDKEMPRKADDDRKRRDDAADDDDRTARAQHRADRALQLHGRRVDRPRIGESSHSYRRRILKQLVTLSPKHRGMDPHLVADDRALGELENAVLECVEQNAYDPAFNVQPGGLREVHEYDRTGRQITKFVGDMTWMDAFRSPTHRARINRPVGVVYNNA